MNKIKLAAATALGVATAAVLGIFAGIMLTHGPTDPTPVPAQQPAGFAQPYVAADPSTTDATDTSATTTDTAIDAPPPVPPAAPDPTTTDATQPPAASTTTTAPVSPPPDVRTTPALPTTTTVNPPYCVPDGTGNSICN